MFLIKKNFLVKPQPIFFRKKTKPSFFFLGKSYFKGYSLNNKTNVKSSFKNPIGFTHLQTSSFFLIKNKGVFSSFRRGGNFCLILLCYQLSVFSKIYCSLKNKTLFKASEGVFITVRSFDIKKKLISFILPSGKLKFTNVYVIGLFGKQIFDFKKNSFLSFYKFGKKKLRVSGVSMNPVDHHNGGRSNRKPLFLNKYNNVAKKNK